MRRVFKLSSHAARFELLNISKPPAKLKPFSPFCLIPSKSLLYGSSSEISAHSGQYPLPRKFPIGLLSLFDGTFSKAAGGFREDFSDEVEALAEDLVRHRDHLEDVTKVLEEKCVPLIRKYRDGAAFVKLLKHLVSQRRLAMEVFNWRRRRGESGEPMTPEEYAKGITIAGSVKDIELADELFCEATENRLRTTTTYNALMAAYMYNGLVDKCHSVFQDLKMDPNCSPSVVTYNILISVFGRLLHVNKMESTLQELRNLNLSPNLNTYNNLIAGYITGWMWDDMERIFQMMKGEDVRPDTNTHLLMLRGYAYAGKLDRMEETYNMVKHHVNEREFPLIRAMICAYCKSSVADRVKKIESLFKIVPVKEHKPWLNVLMIKVYAQERCLESMENSINEAFDRNIRVRGASIMRCIIATYFQYGEVDRLASFVKRAESSGWRICRSLYHCQMVMFSSHRRLEEMEEVLYEMGNFNMSWTKRTLAILYKAYLAWGQKHKIEQVVCLMCKLGYTNSSGSSLL